MQKASNNIETMMALTINSIISVEETAIASFALHETNKNPSVVVKARTNKILVFSAAFFRKTL